MTNKFRVTCVFEDGASTQFNASAFETIYQAALRSGLTLETDCREGACATCKTLISDGKASLGDFSDEALSSDEEAAGYALACQARPQSDLVLQFAYPMTLTRKKPATFRTQVAALEPVADNVMRLVLNSNNQEIPFLPGQYVNLSVDGHVQARSYSFANPAENTQQLEFYVRLLESGLMSDWLRSTAKVGDSVEIEGPYGQFFLRPPRGKEVLMIAGGTGLAPILSMLDTLKARPTRPRVHVLYGANQPQELFALERLAGYGDWVSTHTIVVQSNASWTGPCGYVTDLISQQTFDDIALLDAYLCGPPPMINAATEALQTLGVQSARIFAEKFLPA